jgi:hypothetical protein
MELRTQENISDSANETGARHGLRDKLFRFDVRAPSGGKLSVRLWRAGSALAQVVHTRRRRRRTSLRENNRTQGSNAPVQIGPGDTSRAFRVRATSRGVGGAEGETRRTQGDEACGELQWHSNRGLGRNISLKSPFDPKGGAIGFPQHL